MATYTGKKLSFTQNGNTFILDPVSVFEYEDLEHFPSTGVAGKIYIALDTNIIYRWDATETEYIPISSSGGGSSLTTIRFSIAVTDWTQSEPGSAFQASVTNAKILVATEEIVTYDSSIDENLKGNIKATKDAANNAMIFETAIRPTGVISGTIYSFGTLRQTNIVPVFQDIPFSITASQWTGENAPYTVQITNANVFADSGLWTFYDESYDTYAQASVIANVTSGGGSITFTTNVKPTGTVSGFVRIIDGISGASPPERGGTGATSIEEACETLGAVPLAQKGVANGVATLDGSGLVPSNQLQSYVDDVLEYSSVNNFPVSGDIGKIYVATDTNKSYRWSGSTYVELSAYALATQAAAGLMSAQDKTKLDGIASEANKTVVSDSLSDTSTTNALSAAQGKALNDQIANKVLYYKSATQTATINAGANTYWAFSDLDLVPPANYALFSVVYVITGEASTSEPEIHLQGLNGQPAASYWAIAVKNNGSASRTWTVRIICWYVRADMTAELPST